MKRFAALILAAVCPPSPAACSNGAAEWTQELNEADAPSDSPELSRGGTRWRIDNDELTSLVKSVCRVTE